MKRHARSVVSLVALAVILTNAMFANVAMAAPESPTTPTTPTAPTTAGGQASPAAAEEARRLYAEAHDLFLAGRCHEALPLLLQASKLVPSPNSGLLIARCQLAENKRVEAAVRYAEVERDALNLVRSGETRYAETAAAAAKEGAALRAKLGTLRVRLAPRAGVALEIDGKPTEIHGDGQTTVIHEPGTAKITFVLPAGRRERIVPISIGDESVVTYVDEEKPPPATPTRLPWTFYASGGVAVLGLASFAAFGVASESTYANLESRCAPQCTSSDRADANRGRTFQTVANIGLVVGLVFAVVTGVVLASGPSSSSPKTEPK